MENPNGKSSATLRDDLRDVVAWGGTALLCLMHESELDMLGVTDLVETAEEMGLVALRVPIEDCHAPEEEFLSRWIEIESLVGPRLRANQRVLVHCVAGLGRSPMVAIMLLVSLYGMPVRKAIAVVEAARPIAIDARSREQEDFLAGWIGASSLQGGNQHYSSAGRRNP